VLVTDEKSLILDFRFRFVMPKAFNTRDQLPIPLPVLFFTRHFRYCCLSAYQYSLWKEQYEQKGVNFLYLKPLLFSQRPGEPGGNLGMERGAFWLDYYYKSILDEKSSR
jgi:hypothetical protein